MSVGLDNASKSMINKMQNIQIVANNLANINSTGFKRGLAFSEILEGENSRINNEVTDFSEGIFVETNNPLNAAISGDAYFTVKTSEGEHLTRNGDFIIDKKGFLATRDGFRVLAQNGEVNLQEEIIDKNASITITKNGSIKSDDKIISKLKIVTVENKLKLEKTGGQRFFTSDKIYKAADENSFEIHHGYLESSNTNAIVEMQTMIQLQKDYEASAKMVTSIDAVLAQLKDIGKV